VIFVFAKMIMKKTGTSLFGLLKTQTNNENTNKPFKRKMKGPNIDLSAIPDLDTVSANEPI